MTQSCKIQHCLNIAPIHAFPGKSVHYETKPYRHHAQNGRSHAGLSGRSAVCRAVDGFCRRRRSGGCFCGEFSAHCGAHVDAPAHLFPGTGDAASLPLERFVGPCLVIDLTELEPEAAPSELVRPQTIAAVKALMGGKALPSRVLIKHAGRSRRYGAVIFERCRPNVLKHFWPKVWSLWGLTCRALILQTVRSSLRTALHSAAV